MIGGFLIVLAMIAVPYPGDRNLAWHLQSLCAAMGTVTVILATSASAPIYQLRPIAFLGRISFSIYLVHAIVLDAIHLGTKDPRWIVYPSLLLIVMISWATFNYIEQPATRFINSRFKFRTSDSGSGGALPDRSADQRA
jgi:peptidoglycan/LPS O-acetylase OafA/YrhL